VKLPREKPQSSSETCADGVCAIEPINTWEIVNPEGVTKVEPLRLCWHPGTLRGKTVLLRWNGKQNGDIFLNRVAELLAEKVKGVKVLKAWEVFPDSIEAISGSQERSVTLAKGLSALKPDIVIGSHGD
jgi:hypothetical protein